MGVPLKGNQFSTEKELLAFLIRDANNFTALPESSSTGGMPELANMSAEEKVQAVKNRAVEIRRLNYEWIMRLAGNEGILREKMTLFWSNHFSCRSGIPEYARHLNEVIRTNAMGSFKTLLLEVSKSPAMLQFLNNQQNRKAHPNENFAREVMELFTLGRGHYTEMDVHEAARAFTGWSFDQDGKFHFRSRVHDDGVKSILGETGNFTGEDVISILLSQPQTALFVVEKFWRSFVSETPDPDRIKRLAEEFYQSQYDILALLKRVYLSDWFYEEKYRGALIKSPVELMVPLIRDFNIQFANINVLLGFQKVLGQVLFNPPNVAGWPGGRNWIDSSSLSVRMRTAGVFLKDQLPDFEGKDDADANNPFRERAGSAGGRVYADWSACIRQFEKTESALLLERIAGWLLAVPLSERIRILSEKHVEKAGQDTAVKSIVGFLATLPEFQLC